MGAACCAQTRDASSGAGAGGLLLGRLLPQLRRQKIHLILRESRLHRDHHPRTVRKRRLAHLHLWRCRFVHSGLRLYLAIVFWLVDESSSLSSHGPVFMSKSLPNPTHLPAMRRPVGSMSIWMAPRSEERRE